MNERYQSEQPKGQTKKSAAAAKPKAKAAASVYVRPAGHTPKEKKAIKKAQRAKQAELDRMFYNPPTEQYKKLRRIWWVLLISAIVLTVLGMIMPNFMPDNIWATWICIIPAYGCIIGALWLDFSKIRKVRRAYQMEMMKKHPKEVKQHMATNAANQVAQQKEERAQGQKRSEGRKAGETLRPCVRGQERGRAVRRARGAKEGRCREGGGRGQGERRRLQADRPA